MKRVFIDTNILLDVFLERVPFAYPAQRVWSMAERKQMQAAVSTLSVCNIFFILKKLASTEKAYLAIETLVETFKLIEVTPRIISKALAARLNDFEDAVQYFCALQAGAKLILSRDPSGFGKSRLPVMDCNEYLTLSSY